MAFRSSVLICLLSLLPIMPAPAQTLAPSVVATYGRLPMHFEQNDGQMDSRVRFVARGAGYAFFITDTESVAILQKHRDAPVVIRMRLIGAAEPSAFEGTGTLPGTSNYFLGSDPSKWRTNLPQFGKVRLSGVYDGIDAVYYGNAGEVEYDFVVAPGSDPRQIRMHFEGAEAIEIDESGDLVLRIPGGEIRQRAPFVYQERDGSRHAVHAHYRRVAAREFEFALGAYDSSRPLVIDPVLAWSTYLGGSTLDSANAIAVDAAGSTYVTGITHSLNFPTANALDAVYSGEGDVFVSKLNAAGTALIYSSFLGGSSTDAGLGIAVDSSGNAYVAGATYSTNFPTANAIQATGDDTLGTSDAFVAKLNAVGGALVYSTYLGGMSSDLAWAIAIDASGSAYITGDTDSNDFPTANALQAANAAQNDGFGRNDAFVSKINAAGSALVYSTYLGGSLDDNGRGIAVDTSGNAYITGRTSSPNFPTANAFQTHTGGTDAFVTKLNAAGSAIVYSSYLGGNSQEDARAIAVDSAGNAYIAGSTLSFNFPTANAVQPSKGGFMDAFVTKLNAAGTAFLYSTYLGGDNPDAAFAVAADNSGNAYIAGETNSANFPTANATQATLAGAPDAFVTKLNAAGSVVMDSTYLGGSSSDVARGIAVDAAGNMYVAGFTESTDFPTLNPLQSTNAGTHDAFVAKLLPTNADLGIVKAATGAFVAGQDGTFTITVTNNGPTSSKATVTDTIPAAATFVSATPSQGNCSGTTTVVCSLGTIQNGGTATITLVVRPAVEGPLSNTATITPTADPNPANDSSTAIAQVAASANLAITKTATGPFFVGQNGTYTLTVTNAGPSAASGVTVTDILPRGATFVSATPSQGGCSGTNTITCTIGTIANGASATVTLVVFPTTTGSLSNTATVSSATGDVNPANNASTALVEVQAVLATIPVLDGRTLMLLAALLAAFGFWIVQKS